MLHSCKTLTYFYFIYFIILYTFTYLFKFLAHPVILTDISIGLHALLSMLKSDTKSHGLKLQLYNPNSQIPNWQPPLHFTQ